MSFGMYEVEVSGKVVARWLSLDRAIASALDHGVARAMRRGALPAFAIFYRTALMRNGERVRHLVFTGSSQENKSPAAFERPGPDQQRSV
jgi:hypothetical protein